MAALQYRLPDNDIDTAQIKRCPINNLPDHVKRNVDLDPEDKCGAEWSTKQKGYIAKLQIDTNPNVLHEQPVEFIHNKATGTDNWYLLVPRETDQGTQYYTNEFRRIIQGGTGGLGWWDQFDPEHPEHPSRGKGKAKATLDEETIAGGTHHIITLQGTHPLTPEQPPALLEAISRSTSQGETIQMYFPPTIVGMASSQQPQTPQTQANVTITPAQGSNMQRNGEGGSLMGNAPPIFYGDRVQAQEFLNTITIWKVVNYKKEEIKDPYTRTALVLTYIKGDNVNSWAKRQLDILNKKQQNNPDPSGAPSKTWWTDFKQAFKDTFTFTASKETALAQLEKLTMNKGDIDTYIATFDRLLAEADFTRTDKGALKMFKRGLNMMLKVNCIKRKPKPVTMDEWQDMAQEEHRDYLEVQQALGRNPYNIKETILRNLQKPQPTKFWRAKGPNAMDVDNATVDTASSPKVQPCKFERKGQLTDEQRQALRVLGACFFC